MDQQGNTNGKYMRHQATDKLIDFLKEKNIGTFITDNELKQASGRDCSVNGDGYSYLQSAFRILARDHGQYWERVNRAGGIKRLEWNERLSSSERQRRSYMRKAKRAVTTVNVADPNIPEDRMKDFRIAAAQHNAVVLFASADTKKRLEAKNVEAKPMDWSRLLEIAS